MEPINDALWLLKRQSELESDLRDAKGIRVIEERELYAARARLARYPEAVKAIISAAALLHRPIDALSPEDVLRSA